MYKKIILLWFLFYSSASWSLDENEKLWLGLNYQHTVKSNPKWHTFLFSQFRFINRSHPLQSFLMEGGVGYQFLMNTTVWFGYRWTGHNPNNDFYQENRWFQQLMSQKRLRDLSSFLLRTRFEEIQFSNRSPVAFRLRERLAYEVAYRFFEKIFPFCYEEIFLQLNHTNYTSATLLSENRLFVGFNFYRGNKTWWEIGYLNQYLVHTPFFPQNQMNHTLSITYNFV